MESPIRCVKTFTLQGGEGLLDVNFMTAAINGRAEHFVRRVSGGYPDQRVDLSLTELGLLRQHFEAYPNLWPGQQSVVCVSPESDVVQWALFSLEGYQEPKPYPPIGLQNGEWLLVTVDRRPPTYI